MRLAKLTLCGFKSFADKTEFAFDHPITAIVGPNGCGKSNVVDAIKWVLGERSSKSLRGQEMIDVIFAGSAGRKPLGMASVTLSFENPVIATVETFADTEPAIVTGDVPLVAADDVVAPVVDGDDVPEDERRSPLFMPKNAPRKRGLPIDTDMVDVERRLYRDGGSEYLVNGKKARLKDIRDLFLDTGVGADAYCIIEQGKVDAMLLASPMERRTIFEEAAGVAKFRQRKAEAERKLERTDTNLVRAREQLESTDRRLRMVKGQAAKARQFQKLDEDFRAIKMALILDSYHSIQRSVAGLTAQLGELTAGRDAAQANLATLEAQKQEAELIRHETADNKRRAEADYQNAVHAESSAVQRGRSADAAASSARRQMEADTKATAETDARIHELSVQVEHAADEVAQLSERQSEAEAALQRLGRERAGVLERVADVQAEVSRKRVTVANIDRERAGLLAAVEQDQRRSSVIAEQIARLRTKNETLAKDRQTSADNKAVAEQSTAARRTALAELETQAAELIAKSGTLATDRRSLADSLGETEQSFARMDSRRATLAEMVAARVGLADAARRVLEAKEKGQAFASVMGVLSELIETDQQSAATVEAALGSALSALVVPDLSPAGLSPAELSTLPGRVMFLSASQRSAANNAVGAEAFDAVVAALPLVERVRTKVQARAEHAAVGALLDRQLGRTLLVRDLDSATMLAAGPLAGFADVRFVTNAGEVVEADGRVIAGPMGTATQGASGSGGQDLASGGVLQRRAELDALQTQLEAIAASRDTQRAALKSVDGQASELAEQTSAARTALDAQRRQLAHDESRLEQLGREGERLAREAGSLGQELTALIQRAEALDAERAAILVRAEQLARLLTSEAESLSAAEQNVATVRAEADGTQEAITVAKVEVGRLAEQLGAARRERQRSEWTLEEHRRRAAQLQTAVKSHELALVEQNAAMAEAARTAEAARAQAAMAQEAVAEATEHVAKAVEQTQLLGTQVAAAMQASREVESRWHTLEVSKREAEIKRENLETRSIEELGSGLAPLYFEYLQLIADRSSFDIEDAETGQRVEVGPVAVRPPDQTEGWAEVDLLKAEIKKLGNVNLDAIEEETQLATRNEDLAAQVTDLDQASRQLVELIEKLKEASRERFRTTFETITEHFAGDTGMFRKLFGGGKAEVRLMPVVRDGVETSETDWLESGIEIIARPPGKQPRSISQLSGGEKSMTAVALLMSIFRSKPSCFCVLDEVDAALDDSNVDRFCRVVEEFTTLSSFVVITHHKRTMHQADMLFGVTMQERGVSKRVSVRIDQVGADGEIAETKPAPAVVADESSTATASEHYSDPDSATKAKPRRKRGTVEMNMSPAAAVLNGSELPPMPLTIGDAAPRDDSAALEQAQRAEADERLVRRGLAAMRKRKPVQVPLADQILETPAQGDAATEVVHQDQTALQS